MARKKKEIKTISELKTYIEGAVEFNPEEWSPSKEQWDMIVEMIMNIDEEPVVVAPPPVQQYPVAGGTGEAPINVQQGPSSSMMTQDSGPPPPPIDASANASARPQVEYTSNEMTADPVTGAVSSGITVKTPNLDTSEGKPYQSGFK